MAAQETILLVEDESLLANLLKQHLEKAGFEVMLARDGEEALTLLKKNKPDLMLLDVILPKLSGFDVLKTLKEEPGYNKVPVVIISNLGQDVDVSKGESLGAIGYFIKAKLSIEDLIQKVKDFLKKR